MGTSKKTEQSEAQPEAQPDFDAGQDENSLVEARVLVNSEAFGAINSIVSVPRAVAAAHPGVLDPSPVAVAFVREAAERERRRAEALAGV